MKSTIAAAHILFLIISVFPLLTGNDAFAVTPTKVVPIGFNYPQTGPYAIEGVDQLKGANLAVDQINAAGGILGHKILLVVRNSASNVLKTKSNIQSLIWDEEVKMIFGGASSAVAIAACSMCQDYLIPFFATLSYSTETTAEAGHRSCFRECHNSWMSAKLIGNYFKNDHADRRFFYLSADYTWGRTTEHSIRIFTNTTDTQTHQGLRLPLGTTNFIAALRTAQAASPDVLVLTLFGRDLINCLRQATIMRFKERGLIVVPNLTLAMAKGAGPEAMQGVVGTVPWTWQVPYLYNYDKGIAFVESFKHRFNTYPSTSAASAFTILHEYKAAVERANSFEGAAVIRSLEGHEYQWVKDPQVWRRFDHQSLQTVYLVKGKSPYQVRTDPFELDYFEILESMPGNIAARTHSEWKNARKKAGKPLTLEALPED